METSTRQYENVISQLDFIQSDNVSIIIESIQKRMLDLLTFSTAFDYNQERILWYYSILSEFVHELILADPFIDTRNQRVLIDRTINGLTLQEIGDNEGISRERVRQICKKETIKLTRRLSGRDRWRYITFFLQLRAFLRTIKDEEYIPFLQYVQASGTIYWDVIVQTMGDKSNRSSINNLLSDLNNNVTSAECEESAKAESDNTNTIEDTPDFRKMTATQIGNLLGINGQEVNRMLQQLGLLTGSPGNWSVTDSGTEYVETRTGKRNGEQFTFYVWDEQVIDKIEQHIKELSRAVNQD